MIITLFRININLFSMVVYQTFIEIFYRMINCLFFQLFAKKGWVKNYYLWTETTDSAVIELKKIKSCYNLK